MESNDKFKKNNNIKNCVCYCFDEIVIFENFGLNNNIVVDKR